MREGDTGEVREGRRYRENADLCGCPGGVDIKNFRVYRSNFQLVSSSEGENGAPLELQSLYYLFFAASESRKFGCSFDEQII